MSRERFGHLWASLFPQFRPPDAHPFRIWAGLGVHAVEGQGMTLFLKLAFMASVPVTMVVGWLFARQPVPSPGPDPAMVSTLANSLIALFALQALIIEPLLSRQLTAQRGGYDKNSMIVKLAFFESGAFYGLVITLLTHDPSYVAGFGAAALLLMALRAPVAPA